MQGGSGAEGWWCAVWLVRSTISVWVLAPPSLLAASCYDCTSGASSSSAAAAAAAATVAFRAVDYCGRDQFLWPIRNILQRVRGKLYDGTTCCTMVRSEAVEDVNKCNQWTFYYSVEVVWWW